jgi:hypothetical protein
LLAEGGLAVANLAAPGRVVAALEPGQALRSLVAGSGDVRFTAGSDGDEERREGCGDPLHDRQPTTPRHSTTRMEPTASGITDGDTFITA